MYHFRRPALLHRRAAEPGLNAAVIGGNSIHIRERVARDDDGTFGIVLPVDQNVSRAIRRHADGHGAGPTADCAVLHEHLIAWRLEVDVRGEVDLPRLAAIRTLVLALLVHKVDARCRHHTFLGGHGIPVRVSDERPGRTRGRPDHDILVRVWLTVCRVP